MALTMVLAALALVIWPALPRRGPVVNRSGASARAGSSWRGMSRAGPGRRAGRARGVRTWPWSRLLPLFAAAGTAALAGWPLAVAAGVASATVAVLVRRAAARSRYRAQLTAAGVALRALARDLQSGTAPASAVAAAMASAPARLGILFAGLPGSERDGPVPPAAASESASPLLGVAPRIRAGWAMSARQGIPLATVVSSIADDLADRCRAVEARSAQVAGPAVSGYVLAALPAAGLLLGSGMGADPWAVLTGSGLGGALLITGTTLCCAGLLWADRIVQR